MESQNRVFSMALIHEKLYRSKSLARIDLDEYIHSLVSNLFHSYGVNENSLKLFITVENLTLNIDTVIPCALIINELVSNSLKYAFTSPFAPKGKIPEISICMSRAEGQLFILTVKDNGKGLPEGLEIQKCDTLGLKLVNALVNQLRGRVEIKSENGAEFKILFQEQKKERRPEEDDVKRKDTNRRR